MEKHFEILLFKKENNVSHFIKITINIRMMNRLFLSIIFLSPIFSFAQNVGIGTTTPEGKLHIKGTADTSQLTIDANASQSGTHPLIRLRNSTGTDLMHISTDNIKNVFLGLNAGSTNNQAGGGVLNTFIGSIAGFSNTTGSANTATGEASLYFNNIGEYNSAYGNESLYSNISGNYNTACGALSLYFNTTGNYNIAIGYGALFSNTTGMKNVTIGDNSLSSNTIGIQNVAIGSQALLSNTLGNKNTANGYQALYSNIGGIENTANGNQALFSNTAGIHNTAIGTQALFSNTYGGLNTAIGSSALFSNINGNYNTANGRYTLYRNTTGNSNMADGIGALSANTTGSLNTAIGSYSLTNNETGSNNVAIGQGSGTAVGSPNIQNTISIGNNGILNAANNQAFIGNLSTGWIGGNVTWSTFSDERIKTNIQENVKGLDFIMKLRPVTYYKSMDAITQLTGNKETPEYAGKHDADKVLQSGFLAQEVEQAAKSINYYFSGVHVPENDKQLYSLSYSDFVVPLVKAMQEQQKMITDLQALIKTQQAEINILKQKLK